jgi:hypothetical protein
MESELVLVAERVTVKQFSRCEIVFSQRDPCIQRAKIKSKAQEVGSSISHPFRNRERDAAASVELRARKIKNKRCHFTQNK